MKTTVRKAIIDATNFIAALADEPNLDQKIIVRVEDNWGLNYADLPDDGLRSASDLTEGETIEFSYTDLEGNRSYRTGIVQSKRKTGDYGRLMMVHDTNKDEPRWFYEDRMEDIRLAQPH